MPDAFHTDTFAAAAAASGHLDTRTAATEAAHVVYDDLGADCDLVVAFASYHHRAALPEAMETVRQTLNPRAAIACTVECAIGGEVEYEGIAGFSVAGMHLPGITLTPWVGTPDDPLPISRPDAMPERLGITDDFAGAIMFGEPFSTPVTRLLPALDLARSGRGAFVGGFASGASQPGQNHLIIDERVEQFGVAGISLSGPIEIGTLVSQGCRPIGDSWVVTNTNRNTVIELGGRPALEVARETARGLREGDRALLERGLMLGSVIDENARPFGRGDFLVRMITGIDAERDTFDVGDILRAGQTVQFHLRDATTADEDLDLLLDAAQVSDPAFAALLFTCNGRGRQLFGQPSHDAATVSRRLGPIALAGCQAAGEIGPVAGRTFLHAHTAALALFRQTETPDETPEESS